jgi:8-oxo-dGTP pyrophosphatase MutT (NUDIX family)
MSDDDLTWQHISSRYEEAGLMLFEKRIDTLRNPRNGQTFDRLVLESVDWVNVVALDADGRSLMIRQFRFGVGYNTLETPGGMVDPGEDSGTAAARELLEETGYTSEHWQYLGAVEPNPAFHNHLCHHWLAKDVVLSKEQDLGDGEGHSHRVYDSSTGSRRRGFWRVKARPSLVGLGAGFSDLAHALCAD